MCCVSPWRSLCSKFAEAGEQWADQGHTGWEWLNRRRSWQMSWAGKVETLMLVWNGGWCQAKCSWSRGLIESWNGIVESWNFWVGSPMIWRPFPHFFKWFCDSSEWQKIVINNDLPPDIAFQRSFQGTWSPFLPIFHCFLASSAINKLCTLDVLPCPGWVFFLTQETLGNCFFLMELFCHLLGSLTAEWVNHWNILVSWEILRLHLVLQSLITCYDTLGLSDPPLFP